MSVQGDRGHKVVCHPLCFSSSFGGILCCGVVFLQTTWQGSCILLHGSGRAKCHQARGVKMFQGSAAMAEQGSWRPWLKTWYPTDLVTLCSMMTIVFQKGTYLRVFPTENQSPFLRLIRKTRCGNAVYPGLGGRWEQTFLVQFLLFLAFVALWDPSTQPWQWAAETSHPSCVWKWK